MNAAHNPGNRTYGTADGEISLAIDTADQWHALAVCLGRPELAYEGAWEAVLVAPADGPVAAVVAEHLAEDTTEMWLRRLEAHAVPAVAS